MKEFLYSFKEPLYLLIFMCIAIALVGDMIMYVFLACLYFAAYRYGRISRK